GAHAGRAGADPRRRLPRTHLEGTGGGDPGFGHAAPSQAAGPRPAHGHARARGEGHLRGAHAAQARHDGRAAHRLRGGAVSEAKALGRADVARRGVDPARVAGLRVALPFFARRMWVSLRGRPGAAPRVDYDAVALRLDPGLTWIGHATFLV